MNAPTIFFSQTSQSEFNVTATPLPSQLSQSLTDNMGVSIPTGPDQDILRIADIPVSMDVEEKSDIAKLQEDAQRLFPPNVVVPFAQLAEQCTTQRTPETMLQKLYDQGVITGQIGPETANYFMEWMTEKQRNNQHESHAECLEVYTNHRRNYHVLSLMKLHGQFEYLADLSKYLVNSRFHLAPYIEGLQHKYGNLDVGFPVTSKTSDEGSNSEKFRLSCIIQENNGDAVPIKQQRCLILDAGGSGKIYSYVHFGMK